MRLFDYSKEFQVLRDLALDIDFNSETGEIIDNSDTLHDLWGWERFLWVVVSLPQWSCEPW